MADYNLSYTGAEIDRAIGGIHGYDASRSGVVGDDLTNNDAALVVAAGIAKTRGQPLILPTGVIRLNSWYVEAYPGLKIIGQGAGVTTIKSTSTTGQDCLTVDFGSNTDKPWITSLSDFSIIGNATAGHNLYLGSRDNLSIMGPLLVDRIKSTSAGLAGVVVHGKVDQLRFDSVVCRENSGPGFAVGVTAYGDSASSLISETTMINCHSCANGGSGVDFGGQTRTFTILGGEFSHNVTYGIDHNGALGPGASAIMTIIGAYFENANTAALAQLRFGGSGCPCSTVMGCYFSDQASGGIAGVANVIARASATSYTFMSNHFSLSTGKYGIDISGPGASAVNLHLVGNKRAGGVALVRQQGTPVSTDFQAGGATTYRPVAAEPGDFWFDTTLGIPIWKVVSGWVDATGDSV